jgi:cytochrome c biogenesis protein ResB
MHRDIYAAMNDDILFRWVRHTAAGSLRHTWWFFAAFAGLVLLAINTLLCSLQAFKGKWSRPDLLLRISPQVIHAGFLFILLAHLLGAGFGFKLSGMVPEGAYASLPGDLALRLHRIDVRTDGDGHVREWAADVSVYEHNRPVKRGALGPNAPLFYGGTGIYLQSLNFDRGPAAVLVVAKDPGAAWALAGGVLFMLGSITLLMLKWKRV